MMTHSQLKLFITEAILLFILGAVLVTGGYFLSSDNANKRMQNEYHERFSILENCIHPLFTYSAFRENLIPQRLALLI